MVVYHFVKKLRVQILKNISLIIRLVSRHFYYLCREHKPQDKWKKDVEIIIVYKDTLMNFEQVHDILGGSRLYYIICNEITSIKNTPENLAEMRELLLLDRYVPSLGNCELCR